LTDITALLVAAPILFVLACGAAVGLACGIPVYVFQWCRYHWAPRPQQMIFTPIQYEQRERRLEHRLREWPGMESD